MNNLPAQLSVGIMSAARITVLFCGRWRNDCGQELQDTEIIVREPCSFKPLSKNSTFTLKAVTIGKQYHWERQEDQTFRGELSIIKDNQLLTAVNVVDIEDYLLSVISSEMSATAHLEFLKAHAVISRSWVMRQILEKKHSSISSLPPSVDPETGIKQRITWFDHQEHQLFDVCADDHCQRYQGLSRQTNENVLRAIDATRGQVLVYDNHICDCRFSKCCGGRMERFSTCWQDEDPAYLQPLGDIDPQDGQIFCSTQDKRILSQVLNNYDQETTDFYRWTAEIEQEELQQLLRQKLQCDFGSILEFRPLERSESGRIKRLLIRGTRQELVIGKELLIRSALSESHLKSSAFDVETQGLSSESAPKRFILHGRGWGHGVGLCQIGAAVMAEKGYGYEEILAHYYPNAKLSKPQDFEASKPIKTK